MKTPITEEMKVHEEWYKRAQEMTMAELPDFLKELTEDYKHDYGTICHAIAAAAIAAAWAVEKSPSGGITGFQGGAVMWEFIREWNHSSNKTGMKLVDYDNLLYPQYADKMDKVISSETWKNLQKEAARLIAEAEVGHMRHLMEKEKYEEDIKAFVAKYPDYYSRWEHYDHLGMGNSDEWAAYHKKEASGFEFAPRKPYGGNLLKGSVFGHWQSIVDGVVPFGYRVED